MMHRENLEENKYIHRTLTTTEGGTREVEEWNFIFLFRNDWICTSGELVCEINIGHIGKWETSAGEGACGRLLYKEGRKHETNR